MSTIVNNVYTHNLSLDRISYYITTHTMYVACGCLLSSSASHTHLNIIIVSSCVYVYVIVVPWVSSVYGICTLSAVICIPSGGALREYI